MGKKNIWTSQQGRPAGERGPTSTGADARPHASSGNCELRRDGARRAAGTPRPSLAGCAWRSRCGRRSGGSRQTRHAGATRSGGHSPRHRPAGLGTHCCVSRRLPPRLPAAEATTPPRERTGKNGKERRLLQRADRYAARGRTTPSGRGATWGAFCARLPAAPPT